MSSFKIDKSLKEEMEFLKKFKFQSRQRLFEKTIDEYDAIRENNKIEVKKPLFKLSFAVAGKKLNNSNAQIKETIEKMGGNIGSLKNSTIALISSEGLCDFSCTCTI